MKKFLKELFCFHNWVLVDYNKYLAYQAPCNIFQLHEAYGLFSISTDKWEWSDGHKREFTQGLNDTLKIYVCPKCGKNRSSIDGVFGFDDFMKKFNESKAYYQKKHEERMRLEEKAKELYNSQGKC